jgi:pyroglutamyl-peptidase
VHSTLKSFHLERCAYNEADFRIPDGAGRQCKKETIREEDGGLKQCVTTLLPLSTIAARMEELGHPCSLSDDAGRYLCNYLYYHSLKLSASVNGEGNGTGKTTSLFVHVPPFTTIAQPAQETFLADLFRTIATHNAAGGVAQ